MKRWSPHLPARIALIVLVAVGLAWLARLNYAAKVSTNVLDLLPAAEQSPEISLVRHLAGDVHARVALFVLRDSAQPSAPPAAAGEAFAAELRRSGRFADVVLLGDATAQEALGRALFEQRHSLLLPGWLDEKHQQFAQLSTVPDSFPRWLAARVADDLAAFLSRPEALAAEDLIAADPLLLLPGLLERARPLVASTEETAGRVLIWARLRDSPLTEEGQAPVFATIERALIAARSIAPELSLQWTGVNRFAAASRSRIETEISTLNGFSLLAVLLVSVAFVPRAWRLLHVAPVVLCSLLGAWAATTFAFEQVHILVFVIGALLAGVAIDYAFYLYLQPPLYPGEPYGGKLQRLLKPLLASCLTTVAGFSLLLFSDLPLLRQVGFFVGAGLLSALGAAMLYFAQVRDPFLPTRPRRAIRRRVPRRGFVATIAAGVVIAAVGATRLQWRDDIRELEIPSPELRSNDRAVREAFGDTPERGVFLTHGTTLAEARMRLDAFHRHLEELATPPSSLGDVFPTPAQWAALPQRLAALGGFSAELRAALEQRGFDTTAFGPFFEAWDRLVDRPPTGDYSALYAKLQPHLQGPLAQLADLDGPTFWFVTIAANPPPGPPPPQLHTVAVRQLETMNTLFTRYRWSALQLSAIGLTVVIASVFVIYRGKTALRIALIPASACGVVLGLLALCGQTLNLFHLLGAFLGTCLAHNYAIFSAESARAGAAPPTALRLSACTTVASFGVLSFSAIPVIHALGLTVASVVATTLAFVELEARKEPAA